MAVPRQRRARAAKRRRERLAVIAMALFPLLVGVGFLTPGWVRPPRDPARTVQALVRAGAARLPAEDVPAGGFRPLRDLDHVAARVRRLVGSI